MYRRECKDGGMEAVAQRSFSVSWSQCLFLSWIDPDPTLADACRIASKLETQITGFESHISPASIILSWLSVRHCYRKTVEWLCGFASSCLLVVLMCCRLPIQMILLHLLLQFCLLSHFHEHCGPLPSLSRPCLYLGDLSFVLAWSSRQNDD